MIDRGGTFIARDGFGLHERSWAPDGEPGAVVGLLHGGAEHGGRGHTARAVTAAGVEVDAFDPRSHGSSPRMHGVPLQIERFDDLLDDTEAWVATRRQVHGGRPFFVLAHSMGALIAVALAARGRLDADGLITSGAALTVLAPEAFARAAQVAAGHPDAIVSPMPRGGFDASTRDPEMRAVALADDLHADIEGIPARFLVVLHGTADTMAAPAGSIELVDRAASTDKTLHLIEGGYHAVPRDLDRAEVEDLILAWMDARLPG